MNGGVKPSPEEAKARRERARVIAQQAAAARIYRALYCPRQLQEAMVDFWCNHFNVFAGKGLDHLWIGAYEAQAIRPYALGHFRDIVLATAYHPVMLFYLDNKLNTAPGSPGAKEVASASTGSTPGTTARAKPTAKAAKRARSSSPTWRATSRRWPTTAPRRRPGIQRLPAASPG